MLTPLPIAPPRQERPSPSSQSADSLNLVAVASETARASNNPPAPPVSFRLRASGDDARRLRYTRIAAHTVGGLAAWLLPRTGKNAIHNRLAGAIFMAPGGLSELPQNLSGILGQLHREEKPGLDQKAVAAAILALRTADAVIAGPFSADHANAPGMVVHMADLARRAYRALRPPRELLVLAGFGQIARRFQFLQMSHHEARTLAAGAIDIGILAQRLRQLQGDGAEFPITKFGGHGPVWAENRWMETPCNVWYCVLGSGGKSCASIRIHGDRLVGGFQLFQAPAVRPIPDVPAGLATAPTRG